MVSAKVHPFELKLKQIKNSEYLNANEHSYKNVCKNVETNTVFDAVQSPCEFGRISVFEKFSKKIM